jgi:hypothetical protein
MGARVEGLKMHAFRVEGTISIMTERSGAHRSLQHAELTGKIEAVSLDQAI